jgi:GNAT superfamily N-acetyltransferase
VQPPITTRRASTEDLDTIIADVQAGFDSYVEFAQQGWRPPDMSRDSGLTVELLADAGTWALIAEVAGAPAGHASFFPARARTEETTRGDWRRRPVIPGLAHLWQLFILPEWWGRGVAPLLHEAAVAEMQARGFQHARLFTPSLHARARRFYERRGWRAVRDEYHEWLALMLTEYRLDLSGSGSA